MLVNGIEAIIYYYNDGAYHEVKDIPLLEELLRNEISFVEPEPFEAFRYEELMSDEFQEAFAENCGQPLLTQWCSRQPRRRRKSAGHTPTSVKKYLRSRTSAPRRQLFCSLPYLSIHNCYLSTSSITIVSGTATDCSISFCICRNGLSHTQWSRSSVLRIHKAPEECINRSLAIQSLMI